MIRSLSGNYFKIQEAVFSNQFVSIPYKTRILTTRENIKQRIQKNER